MKRSRIAIIGAGSVGSTTAYTIILKNIATEILLVDVDEQRCKGEVLDLADALPFYRSSLIRQGTLKEAGQADIVVISAGIRQQPEEPRTALVAKNQQIVSSIIANMQPLNKDLIIIVISNPVDVLTQCVQELSGLPRKQVVGSGTLLDSLRLRGLIKNKIGVAEQSIQVFILGEHGDAQFPAWSSASIAGIPIMKFPGLTRELLESYAQETRAKAYDIIACKQATYYGVAACVASMCESIIFDQRKIIPLSWYVPDLDVCLNIPVVLGACGVDQVIPLMLDAHEQQQLEASAAAIKAVRS